MKKRTKISLRTKIYLTFVGLFALTGVLYAIPRQSSPFSAFPQIPGLAAAKTELLRPDTLPTRTSIRSTARGFPRITRRLPSEKNTLLLRQRSPRMLGSPRATSSSHKANASIDPRPGAFALFTIGPLLGRVDHSGITFDKVGTFGNDMIVTCNGGDVFKIDKIGNVPQSRFYAHASSGGEIEGPVVAPLSFGTGPTFGGQILVADEDIDEVHAIKNDGPPGHRYS